MRDIAIGGSINASGDVIFHDQSGQYKPLEQCTAAELLVEEEALYERWSSDRHKTGKITLKGLIVGSGLFLVAFVWGYLLNNWDLVTAFFGILGLMIAFKSLADHDKPTRFQLLVLEKLQAIDDILRLRGVR